MPEVKIPSVEIDDLQAFELWKATNVIEQKQSGLSAIGIKVFLGDFYTDKARILADLIKNYAGNEIRLSLRQNILIRHVKNELLPFFYVELKKLGFVDPGYESTSDITSCPGTDTCNLGIASSTGASAALENVLKNEFPQYVNNKNITIKISGCMNSCGQHTMAHIGFQGMSIKSGNLVAPALQVLLGGGVLGNGNGRIADKVLKIPSKRGPEALRFILNDYEANVIVGESFLDYYDRKSEKYFYNLLKDLSDTTNLQESDFVDWGADSQYITEVGVGECAGVVIDLIATLLFESEEKLENAVASLQLNQYSDSIYYSYTSMVNTAKALLIAEGEKTNTHAGIISDFEALFSSKIELKVPFSEFIFQIKNNEPSQEFAQNYLTDAQSFYKKVDAYRALVVADEK